MTAPLDLPALRALAEAATPGPWRWGDWRTTFGLLESEFRATLERNLTHPGEPGPVRRNRGDGCTRVMDVEDEIRPEDAAFIAAASPDVILALIARVEAAEARVAQLENDLEDFAAPR